MKLTTLLLAFSLFAPLGIACSPQGKLQGSLTSYQYSYAGSMSRSGTYYKVELAEDGSVRISYSNEGRWGPIKVYRGPADALETIDKMIADGKLNKLHKEYKNPMHILDGWSWSLYIRYEKGSIDSGGYMAKPSQGLWAAIEGINAYIDTLLVEENYLETVEQ